MAKSNRGRKPKGEYVGKSAVMSFRITPDTLAALKKSAKERGVSLSQETEHRLRRDLFEHGSMETYTVMRTLGYAIDNLVNIKNPKAHWLHDPYLFQQAKQATVALFDLLAPPAAISIDDIEGPRRQGLVAINELLRSIQLAEDKPRVKQTTEERALLILKSDLKNLAERPRPYGKSAEQLRKEVRDAANRKRRKP
jgi:hypothetical protein